jgi:hypothetical protein
MPMSQDTVLLCSLRTVAASIQIGFSNVRSTLRSLGLGMACVVALGTGCSHAPSSKTAPTAPITAGLPTGVLDRPTGNVDELLAEAHESAEANDLDSAIATLERAVLIDATDRRVLFRVARYSQERAREVAESDATRARQLFLAARSYLDIIPQLHQKFTDQEQQLFAQAVFDEACVYGRSGDAAITMKTLQEAIAAGFRDFNRLHTEPSLAFMSELDEFKRLLATHPVQPPPP